MNKSWNVSAGNNYFQVDLNGSKLTINPGQTYKLRTLSAAGSNMLVKVYSVPIPGNDSDFKLYITNKDAILTSQGIDVLTGMPYTAPQVPKWIFVFYVLYLIDFFLLVGGAVGGALNMVFALLTSQIASSKKMSTSSKLLASIALFVGATILEFVLAVFVFLPLKNSLLS